VTNTALLTLKACCVNVAKYQHFQNHFARLISTEEQCGGEYELLEPTCARQAAILAITASPRQQSSTESAFANRGSWCCVSPTAVCKLMLSAFTVRSGGRLFWQKKAHPFLGTSFCNIALCPSPNSVPHIHVYYLFNEQTSN